MDFELEVVDDALSIMALGTRSLERHAEGWELLGIARTADGGRYQIWMRLNVETFARYVA